MKMLMKQCMSLISFCFFQTTLVLVLAMIQHFSPNLRPLIEGRPIARFRNVYFLCSKTIVAAERAATYTQTYIEESTNSRIHHFLPLFTAVH